MKIRILGTGYGECKIKKKSIKDFRHRGGVLIDERILLDAPGDIFDAAEQLGFSDIFDNVHDVVISHSHEGHFSGDAILKLAERNGIRVYASESVLRLLPDESERLVKIQAVPFFPLEVGEYRIIPTPSNHETEDDAEECLNYIVFKDKALFYALDGGFLNYGAWKLLSEIKLDAVICDCALEAKPASRDSMIHNNIYAVKAVKDILTSSGVCTEGARFVATHIPSDKKRSVHEELSEIASEYGITVAYDGYFFSF